ncbi:SDR family oxidoreductase [Candidimonas nitroreducens]|uniref:3-oxoacyl-ACP reductase n=1 Tax=Candidimonas nitroreducens TaxID=683354 RepID=A0A225MV16_9BURK|nr:SDR family oxidoreductase [Candidimonas nitroreducens]OWT63650.1 3-oxoacyl-ACP reductase [Candidimonas nitroreducens]
MNSAAKVALVTGAGSGIGKAIALALMRHGYAVVLAGRRLEPLQAVAAQGAEQGARALAISADISDPASVQALFARIRAGFGRLDLLFNNAGIFNASCSLEDLPLEQWRQAVDINLTGAFLCTQEAFRIMKAQQPRGGRIINNGSISAHCPRPQAVSYTATKHAITGLTKATSLDGRKYDIACGQIDIGNASTELTEGISKGVLQADGTVHAEPTMNVQHVADAVLYMAGLPLEANVQFMTVMATKMPFVGRG